MSVPSPSSTLTILDGGLGITSAGANTSFKVGVSSAGTAGSFYSYAGSDTALVVSQLGKGPLVDAIITHLLVSKGQPVIAYKQAPSTAGTSTAVTQVGTGPLVTLSGAPYDQSESIIKITTGGVIGTSQFKYSLDGGDTYSDIFATAATYLLPNGVTANFAAGTYVVDTTYSWTDTAPVMTSANVGAACDAIIASPYSGEFVHIVGQAPDASGALTVATLLSTKVISAHAARKYMFFIFEAPAVDKAGIATSFASFDDKFVVGVGGFLEYTDEQTSRISKRSAARLFVPRVARNPLAIMPSRDAGDSDLESLSGVYKLVPDGAAASTGYHDEGRTPGLQAARFNSLTTITGRAGYFINSAITLANNSSDYQLLPYVRIVLAAARAWYTYSVTQFGRRIRKDPTTGFIRPAIADAMETKGAQAVRAALGDSISRVKVLVKRDTNLTTTPTVYATIRLVVDGYALAFDTELGLADSLPA
jgi:hypothetical protein